MALTLIHLSDLHFFSFPESLSKWFSKRVLGSANFFFRKQKHHPLSQNQKLVETIKNISFDHLIISGDVTYLGLEKEFQLARKTLNPLLQDQKSTTIIPGNHDRYTIDSCYPRDLFREFFGPYFSEDEVKFQRLNSQWHLIAWDSTHPNGWITASGTVRLSTLKKTEAYIRSQSSDSYFIIVNHFPLWFPQGFRMSRNHELYNYSQVKHWLTQQKKIKLYLHGHVHFNWHEQILRQNDVLHVVNSASSSETPPRKSSSFHRIKIENENVRVEPMSF